MPKQVKQLSAGLLIAIIGLSLFSPSLFATSTTQSDGCVEVYTVQVDDWLSKIADKFLGNMLAFPAIFEATNQQHAVDNTFAQIENPDLIEVGWQLCIPGEEAAAALLTNSSVAPDAAPLEPVNLTIFAAASLTEAFAEIGQNFEVANPNVSITLNFAGSQQLAQQLNQGAPADVFASADNTQMDVAMEAGRVISDAQQTFVRNRLVVVYPADNPARVAQLQDLAQPNLRLILAAEEVPVGRYSQQFLDKASQDSVFGASFKARVLGNVVSFEPNVKVVLTKVALGEGDAGIVYSSDVTPEVADQVGQLDIPDELNTIATYPIAIISDTAYPVQAQAFVDYVLSPAGQDVLAKFGFISPN